MTDNKHKSINATRAKGRLEQYLPGGLLLHVNNKGNFINVGWPFVSGTLE